MIVVAVILYATLNSDPVGVDDLPVIPHLDKIIHAIMFGGLFAALCFDLYRSGRQLSTGVKVAFAIACAVAGGLDEAGQILMENGRSGDIADWIADCTGIAVAYITAPPAIRRVVKR